MNLENISYLTSDTPERDIQVKKYVALSAAQIFQDCFQTFLIPSSSHAGMEDTWVFFAAKNTQKQKTKSIR